MPARQRFAAKTPKGRAKIKNAVRDCEEQSQEQALID
jgi:hypothetical protein